MSESRKQPDLKAWAKLLYTQHDKTTEKIAQEINADETSIRYWVTEGAWDGLKTSLLISRNAQLKRLYGIMDALHRKTSQEDYEITTKEADLFLKYTNAVKNLEGEITTAVTIEACGKFFNWLRQNDMDLLLPVMAQFDDYVKHITSPLNA